MNKLPALHFYVGDWRKDIGVQSLSYHDRGIWFEILCLMHESENRGKLILNGKAMSNNDIARILGLDNQILESTLTSILDKGVASRCNETGALMSRRMVKDELLRETRKKCGEMGGNPNLVNQNSTKTSNRGYRPPEDEDEDEDESNSLIEYWNNKNCFKKIIKMSSGRKSHFRQRIKDKWWGEKWMEGIDILSKSGFCTGRIPSSTGDYYVADIDFFLRPDTLSKIFEGKYDDKIKPQQKPEVALNYQFQ